MRLKSLHTQRTLARATNQRIKTCVSNMFMLFYLLSSEVWSFTNIKEHRFVRQHQAENIVNYEDNTNLYHQPHFTGNRSVIVQLFEWKFVDVAAECRNFLGPKGYAGVQLSPVLEHSVIKTSQLHHPWWERYEVISYRLASRSGDESEFWSMSRICNDHGVRIYADVVLNHMAAPPQYYNNEEDNKEDFIVNTLLETNVNISQLNYSNVTYTQQDFHRPECAVLSNTQDAHEIRNCQLNGHPDLDLSRASVQKHIVQMLNKFIDMGVAGFRIDTAKYIWPIDLKNIFKQVKNLNTEFNFKENSRPFLYYDVFDLGLDTVSKTEYTTYGVVSEYLYPAELSTIIQGKVPLSSLINWGPALGFLPHDDSLVFIDSHDTQRGLPEQLGMNKMLTHKQRLKYLMANIFMLVHPYGHIKRIMSSYYFSDINQGPPKENDKGEEIRSPEFNEQEKCTKESGWVCEHRWPELVSVLKVANYFRVPGQEDYSVIYFQTNGANQVAFCRGNKAFVAINNDRENDFVMEVFACLEPGTYCDMVTGGKKEGKEKCHGKQVVINNQGYIKLELAVMDSNSEDYEQENEMEEEEESGRLENYGILVIYIESKIQPNENAGEEDVKTEENGPEDNDAKDDDNQNDEGDENSDKVPDEEDKAGSQEPSDKENEAHNEEIEVGENATEEQEAVEEDDDESEKETEDTNAEQPAEADINTNNEENEEAENDTSTENKGDEANEETEGENLSKPEEEEAADNANEEPEKENSSNPEGVEQDNPGKDSAENADEENSDKKENEEPQEPEENSENEEISNNEEESPNEEPTNEEPEQNSQEESPNNEEAEVIENDSKEGEQVELVKENSQETAASPESNETPAENLVEEPEIVTQNINEDIEHNQSRNLDEKSTNIEEQIEQPITEITDEIKENVEQVTQRVPQVLNAGILSNPKGQGNNG